MVNTERIIQEGIDTTKKLHKLIACQIMQLEITINMLAIKKD